MGGILNAILGAIGAAASVAGTAGSIASSVRGKRGQQIENQKQRDFELQMYQRQKQDNQTFWQMENYYNSPAMQMQRLKDAGLNPNLMYGSPQSGGNAGSIQSPSQGVSNSTKTQPFEMPQMTGMMDSIYDTRLKSAQINNINEQSKTEATKRDLNIINTLNKGNELNYNMATMGSRKALLNTAIENAITNIASSQNQSRVLSSQNNREMELQPGKLKQQIADLLQTRANTTNLGTTSDLNITKNQREQVLKQIDELELQLRKAGYTPNDTAFERVQKMLVNSADSSYGALKNAISNAYKWLKDDK